MITSTNNNGQLNMNGAIDQQLTIIQETVRKYRDHLPEQRPPVILIAGKTGNGKTTSINTLFGEEVGKIGYYSRGTSQDQVYEWESQGENIHVVDLPGLGDSPKNDKVFREIYSQRVKEADGFIVVVCPPRPAEEGTLKTIRLLLKCGVPSKHIIFGFNKISELKYRDNGGLHSVRVDGLMGVTHPRDLQIVDEAKKAFLETLKEQFPRVSFTESQVIEYDSISGWNMYKMLTSVLDKIPFQTAVRLKRAADEAHRELRKREEERLKREKELIQKAEAELKQKAEEERRFRDEQERLEEAKRQLEARERAIENLEDEREKFQSNLVDKFLDGATALIKLIDPIAAEDIEMAREFVQKTLPAVATKVGGALVETGKKAGETIKSVATNIWNSLFG